MPSATLLFQAVLAGLTNGFVYALIGLGLSVVFRGTRIINAMQGEFGLIAGIVAYLVLVVFGLHMALAFVGAVVAGRGVGPLLLGGVGGPPPPRGGAAPPRLPLPLAPHAGEVPPTTRICSSRWALPSRFRRRRCTFSDATTGCCRESAERGRLTCSTPRYGFIRSG